MPRFRATMWVLTAMAAAVEGDAGTVRRVVEHEAESESDFRANLMDEYIGRNVDNSVTFGPITRKE